MRSPGAVYTLVRTSSIGATRPFTEMQSGNVRHRKHWHARRNTEDNTMTSIGPKAQGKSIKRVVLTGESSYGKVDTHRLGTLSFELDRRTIAERRV